MIPQNTSPAWNSWPESTLDFSKAHQIQYVLSHSVISPHKAVPLLALPLSIKGTTIYPVLEVRILRIIFATFCHFLHLKYLSIIYFICLSTMTVLLPYAKLLLSLTWADAKVSKLFFLCPLMSLTLHPHVHTKLFSSQRTRISFWKREIDHDSTLNFISRQLLLGKDQSS